MRSKTTKLRMSLKTKTLRKSQKQREMKQMTRSQIVNKKRGNIKFDFSYILSHSGIVTPEYPYEIQVPDNIRLIQYTPKGNTLTEIDVLYLFNEFKKKSNKKGIIKNPQYFSLNKENKIFESDLQLTVTEPGAKTNNLFLYYNQNDYTDEFFQNLIDNSKKLPVMDSILNESMDAIKSYLHIGLYECMNNKKYELNKLGDLDNLIDNLTLNSNNRDIVSKSNSFPDYILYSDKNKQNNRYTLQEMLVGLSKYYEKKHPNKIVNFVQLGCNVEENNKKQNKYKISYEEYVKNVKNKEFGFFKISDFREINERLKKNENKNILTIKNIDDNVNNGFLISSNKSDVEEYVKNNVMSISS